MAYTVMEVGKVEDGRQAAVALENGKQVGGIRQNDVLFRQDAGSNKDVAWTLRPTEIF